MLKNLLFICFNDIIIFCIVIINIKINGADMEEVHAVEKGNEVEARHKGQEHEGIYKLH